jgi:diaminopimelate epimerase
MCVAFTKMHGLGNDFVLLELPAGLEFPTPAEWQRLSDRHRGIGFDQAVVMCPPRRSDTDVFYRIVNADGSEVEQSGNGARCLAALLHQRGRSRDNRLTMESVGGVSCARFLSDGRVSVDMGVPNFDPQSLPFLAERSSASYRMTAAGRTIEFGAVSIGNPHVTLRVDATDTAPVEAVGRALQNTPEFPRAVNVGFMQVLSGSTIRLRVYERGAGETQACGTGACAAVVIGRNRGWLDEQVEVRVPGGVLSVHWEGAGKSVWLTGVAQQAYEGTVEL